MNDQEKFQYGDIAEQEWSNVLRARGHDVARSGLDGNMLNPSGGKLIAPDLYAVKDGVVTWHEVKRKTLPGYRYKGQYQGWESGIDLHRFHHYFRLHEHYGQAVVIAIRHDMTPDVQLEDWTEWRPPSPVVPGDWTDYHRFLVRRSEWRWTTIQAIAEHGHEELKWSDGPGMLFPLSITRKWLT